MYLLPQSVGRLINCLPFISYGEGRVGSHGLRVTRGHWRKGTIPRDGIFADAFALIPQPLPQRNRSNNGPFIAGADCVALCRRFAQRSDETLVADI